MQRKGKRGLSILKNRQKKPAGKPGASIIPYLFLLAIIAYGMMVGIRYAGIKIRYADLRDKTRATTQYAIAEPSLTEEKLIEQIVAHAKKRGVVINPDSIYIEKDGKVLISFSYTDSLLFPFTKKVIYFYFTVEESTLIE